MTRQEWKDAVDVVTAENPELGRGAARALIGHALTLGAHLHDIYERQCNGHQTWDGRWDEAASKRDEAREEVAEARLRKLFAEAGLGLYLNTDPRGCPVGILTPKSGRYNTMGGREGGWRIG